MNSIKTYLSMNEPDVMLDMQHKVEADVERERLKQEKYFEEARIRREEDMVHQNVWQQQLRALEEEQNGIGRRARKRQLASVPPPPPKDEDDPTPDSGLPHLTSEEVAQVEADMASRRAKVRRECAKNLLDTELAEGELGHNVGWEFMMSPKKKLIWCHVFKSASSTYEPSYVYHVGTSF